MGLKFFKVFGGFSVALMIYAPFSNAQGLIELYEKAQENAPSYQVKNYAFQAIKSKADKIDSGYYPSINFNANYSHTWQEVLRSDSGIFPQDKVDYPSNNLALTLKQKIYDGSLLAQKQKSSFELSQSQLQLQAAQQDLIYQVTEGYFSLLAAEDQLVLSKAELRTIQSEYEVNRVKFQKGIANLLEWQEIQSRFAEAKANVSESELGVLTAKFTLKQLTGEMPDSVDKLQNKFNEASLANLNEASLFDEVFKKNLNFLAQKKAVMAAEKEVLVQKRGHYPTLDFELSASKEDAEGSLYSGGNNINTYQAKISLNVPIYQGGFTSASIDEARQQKDIQRTSLIEVQRQVETELQTAIQGIQAGLIKIDAMRTSVEAYSLSLSAKRSGLQSGLFTGLDVLDAEGKLYFAKKQLSESLYQMILNYLKIKQVTGNLDIQELTVIQSWLKKS